MSDASHLELVRAYFDSCTSGTADQIAAHFTEDATIYDTNHTPVVGREAIGKFWARTRQRWEGARWVVDSVIEDRTNPDAAAIEWSMHGIADGQPFSFRGSEHYRFRDGLIDEIRQYWTYDPKDPGSALVDFDYSEFDARD